MLTILYPKLCQEIPKDDSGSAHFGLPLTIDYPYWLAINSQAHPALLLPARTDDLRPDISLRAVEVLFSRACIIDTKERESHQGCYSIVRLKENDPAIVRLFLKILEERFCTLNPPANNSEIAVSIQQVAALFSRIADNTRDLIGLWGELHVISCVSDINAAVRCWSSRNTAKYDFVSDTFVLDVKTTTKSWPLHRFSLEQLRPSRTYNVFIVSLCAVEVQSGQTVGVLMDSLAARIDDRNLRSTFLTQCLEKGGRDLYDSDLTLQTYPEEDGLDIFRASDIPAPKICTDDPIKNVRFDVDLSTISPVPEAEKETILTFGVGT